MRNFVFDSCGGELAAETGASENPDTEHDAKKRKDANNENALRRRDGNLKAHFLGQYMLEVT